MDKSMEQQILRTAAEWWMRLRDSHVTDATIEQWLEWTGEDKCHLEAFERVTELGNKFGTLDDATLQLFVREFPQPAAVPRRWVPFAAAASVAMALVGGYFAWNTFLPDAAPQMYVSAVGQNRNITLPDGSTVTLGGASTLLMRFSRGERHVELRGGEAFFQVVHRWWRPFVVTAGNVTIRDIGTAFDVRRTGQRVSIAVTQGLVQIADNGSSDTTGTGKLQVAAGQLVSYDPAAPAMSIASITPEHATAWRNDRLEFINEPLGVVIANVNRYSARPVHIADADLERLTYTGTIKTGAIDSWLKALPEVFPLRVNEGDGQVILAKPKGK